VRVLAVHAVDPLKLCQKKSGTVFLVKEGYEFREHKYGVLVLYGRHVELLPWARVKKLECEFESSDEAGKAAQTGQAKGTPGKAA
jgi:hypothetical protein